jgi:hypothetical protein
VLFGILTEIALILFLTYTPIMQRVFGLAPLGLRELSLLLLFPVIVLLLEEFRKLAIKLRGV